MASRSLPADEYELLGRRSRDSSPDDFHLDELDTQPSYLRRQPPWLSWLSSILPLAHGRRTAKAYSTSRRACLRRRGIRSICYLLPALFCLAFLLAILASIFNPSYTNPPAHYQALRERARQSGLANPNNEKVFVATNIIDGSLIRGAWGKAVLDLVELLGQENVFLSIYENDSGPETTEALRELERKVKCNSSIVSEHLPTDSIPTVQLPSGEQRIKRVAYLANVRNHALRPLDPPNQLGPRSFNHPKVAPIAFDKMLFLNDVIFSPLDAAQLLFSTNMDENGRANYRAACAVDFINAFKFYDTYATRDNQGYSMGVPFFPWFSSAGAAQSRRDVLAGKDAVRVRSCWGGMVAFEAKWFQQQSVTLGERDVPESPEKRQVGSSIPRGVQPPLRFRSEPDTFWDASECCLIHADLQRSRDVSDLSSETGIYINPFIRVAYDTATFHRLGTTRRWERLYTIPHHLVNKLAGLPFFNPRRTEVEGEEVVEKVWVYDDPNWQNDNEVSNGAGRTGSTAAKKKGSYQMIKRTATRGGFCGKRALQVLKKDPKKGEKMWESLPVPPG